MLTGLYSLDSIPISRRRFLVGNWGGTVLMTVTSVIGRVVKPCVRGGICHFCGADVEDTNSGTLQMPSD